MEKITFRPDGERPEDFFVLGQTVIGGRSYILVTADEEGDAPALVLCDLSAPDDTEAVYAVVTDEAELDACARIFGELLADDGIEIDLE